MRALVLLAALGTTLASAALTAPARADDAAATEPSIARSYAAAADRIHHAATVHNDAWEKLVELCDGIGHRLSGSPELDEAIRWAAASMEADGQENVRIEPVTVPHWVRGAESLEMVEPRIAPLVMLGLGGSVGTPPDGITAEVLVVRDEEEFEALGDRPRGRIVLFNNAMPPFDPERGASYGRTVRFRSKGARIASEKGAVACLVRSVTAHSLQSPHTGAMNYGAAAKKIPAAAISVEDAELIARLTARGERVVVNLKMEARTLDPAPSGNVIGELRGSTNPEEVVVIGGHIDSWDVGTGAHDDGACCVMAMEAINVLRRLDMRPRRTIRVVLWTNEENGLAGGRAYAKDHADELANHVAAIEADSGAFAPRGYSVECTDDERQETAVRQLEDILGLFEPIGADNVETGFSGADVGPMRGAGVVLMGHRVEGSTYFDLHHSHADTVDKVDPDELTQNVAVLATVAYILADMPARLGEATPARVGAAQARPAGADPLQPDGAPMVADMVIRGGRIVTLGNASEVEAVAIRGDRILAVGTAALVETVIGPRTRIIDLEGALAIPGFIEGHGHFVGLGEAKMNLDLMHVKSWSEVVALVADAAAQAQPGDWITGRGWHQEKWDSSPAVTVGGFPTHDELSDVSPRNPVLLTHASGHANFANKRAMDLAGISGSTPDPPGGEILRDASGNPIGVFNERAQGLVARAHAQWLEQTGGTGRHRTRRAIELATRECLAKGVTSFQDAGSSFDVCDALIEMAESGELEIRLWVMIREPNDVLGARVADYATVRRAQDGFLTIGGLKRSIDGALGSRGAWLLRPYSDDPSSSGLATASVADVTETARIARENGMQMCVHAIGDRANREVLDIYEQAFPTARALRDRRWRIEHAQHIHPADIPRFGRLGVIAAMQGVHCTSDAPWVIARLGKTRAEGGAYMWRMLEDTGAMVINGTDAPVEDVDPIASFYATVTRRLADGSVFYPDQCLTRMEALRSYTIDAAYAAFEEDIKGSLTPGKLADIVVLSQDILTVDEERIPETEVLLTIVGGTIVFDGR